MPKSKAVIEQKEIAELKKQKKNIKKQKKIRVKKAKKTVLKAEKEQLKRQQHKLIQSTQLSVPIRDVLRGIIITKDSRYLKILEFAPQNFLMFSPAERNRISENFASMLKIIPAKIQFKVFSRKAKVESLVKTMADHYTTETNEMCRRMQDEYINLIEDTALREGVSRRFLVIIEYSDDVATDGTNFKAIVSSLNSTAARVRNYMEQSGNLYIPTCDTDAGVTSLLYELLNRNASEHEPFSARVNKVYSHYQSLNTSENDKMPVIPATEFIAPVWMDYKHPSHLAVDNKFYTFGYFSSEGYPNYVLSGWLSSFVNACEGVDVDIFMERLPRDRVENNIGRQIRLNRAKIKDTSDTTSDYADVANVIQSGLYLLNGIGNGEDFYYVNIIITVAGDSLKEVNFRYGELERMAKTMGVKLRRTVFQMEQAFESTLPLCKIHPSLKRKSKRNMLSSGAASLYPFISFELQDPNGIMLGVNKANNSLVAVDVFDTKSHANANGAILGQSGYGKTFTAQLLAIRMRLQNIQTFIITPLKGKEDYKRACTQIDGQYINFGPGTPYSINIFDIAIPDDKGLSDLDGYEKTSSLLAKKVQDLHTFLHLVVRDLSQEEEQLLDGYIYKVYESYGIVEDNESLYIPNTKELKEGPILGDLYNAIIDVPELRRVANIMVSMITGSLSHYNKRTNVDLSNKYIVFDMDGIKGENLVIAMFITLSYVWGKIKENRLEKKAVFIDEAWQLIGKAANEMTAEYVKEIFKTIRAFGGSAFVMTQELSDFFSLKDGEYGKAIIGNSDTKIILHLNSDEANMVRNLMSLTDDEYSTITKLTKGNGLVSTGNSKLFVDFKASTFETEVITTDPEYLRAKIKRMSADKLG